MAFEEREREREREREEEEERLLLRHRGKCHIISVNSIIIKIKNEF